MKKKNLLVLGGIVLLIAIIFVVATIINDQPGSFSSPDAPTLTAGASEMPQITASPEPAATASAEATATPTAKAVTPIVMTQPSAYLIVTVNNQMYQPIALTKEDDYTINQANDATNVIHVTRDSVSMGSSNCEGQDCVLQGTVTLDNKSTRVLGNMIVCLPHKITLELYTAEEMQAYIQSIAGTGAAQ